MNLPGSPQEASGEVFNKNALPKRNIYSGLLFSHIQQNRAFTGLYHSQENYQYCLRLVFKNALSFEVSIFAYCLMPTHYHFLLRPDGSDDGLSKCMGYAFNSYAQALNKQHRWHGPLFQDRFKAVGVDSDDSLIHFGISI
jgi:putative transposase